MFIFGIWRPENAISAQSSSTSIKSMILDILVLGLEIPTKTTTLLLYLRLVELKCMNTTFNVLYKHV